MTSLWALEYDVTSLHQVVEYRFRVPRSALRVARKTAPGEDQEQHRTWRATMTMAKADHLGGEEKRTTKRLSDDLQYSF